MAEPDDELWVALRDFRIGDPDARLSFTMRLAAENGWSNRFADRVIREYKRFLYLAIRAGHQVTPSDEVDQAWHLHLSYTKSYWDDLCGHVLGKRLHHNPTTGGPEQQARFIDQYERTLDSYRMHFGEAPPTDIWPPAGRRFSEAFRRVNLSKRWVLPKLSIPREWALPLFWISTIFGGATYYLTARPGTAAADQPTHPMVYVFAAVALMVLVLPKTTGTTARRRSKDSGCGTAGTGCTTGESCSDSGCGSGCGGGCGGGD